MQVGDLIRFENSGYTAIILEFTDQCHVRMLVTQPVDFENPSWISWNELRRFSEVVSSVKENP